ncbi:hypothetical protein RND81_06G078300 [Saponaria officinalis]|uniref:Cystatin domain-containing protein n=1 Tax=Saponaria officinalis TaxID=3572 RepID=A0AAW1K7Z6_SAPOF
MNTRSLFFVISLLAVISTASTIDGSYKPIPDLHDRHVQEIAKYAVSEHNKQTSARLEYVEIVKGESQVVAGTKYRLVISAKDDGAANNYGDANNYEAVVYEKPWAHYLSLTSFTTVN